jgi:flagellar export protein FliJ
LKRFTFPLERVRLWRKSQIDIEYAKLQRLFEEMRVLEASVASLYSTVEEARSPIQIAAAAGNILDGSELARLDDYQLFARHQVEVFKRQKQQLLERIAAQRTRLLEARRNFALLDKLKERAQEKWQVEYDRELENLASEVFLAKWNRG